MQHNSYNLPEYRQKQSATTKANWEKGLHNFLRKREERICKRLGCGKTFTTTPSDPRVYCSSSCATRVNNVERGPWPEEIKKKIARAATGKKYPNRKGPDGAIVAKVEVVCGNPLCAKPFLSPRWMKRKFCGNACAMKIIGGKATSPRAARGKAGIRLDLSPTIYFYSRWEANIARLYTYLGIAWVYAPSSFDIGDQMYTPDFYLPGFDTYVEVKNFWWKYSKQRDEKFRKLYPRIKLEVILKPEYLELEEKYSHAIQNWEYKNSKF